MGCVGYFPAPLLSNVTLIGDKHCKVKHVPPILSITSYTQKGRGLLFLFCCAGDLAQGLAERV